jgi:polyhydroxyalkanoate synthase
VPSPTSPGARTRTSTRSGAGFDATSRALLAACERGPGLSESDRRKATFFSRQLLAAMSPANLPWSNPVVLREAFATGGASLMRGALNLLDDVDPATGRLRVAMSDESAFEVRGQPRRHAGQGRVAERPDAAHPVRAATAQVARRPLLVIPPWLNKYYILDLQPQNSMVRWLVEQGHTVFLISWVNPDAGHAAKTFDDYLLEGPIAALDAIERATGEREVNAVGYCLGGILLACTAAWLAARGESRLSSMTMLTSLLEYSEVGEIRAFVDEGELAKLARGSARKGYIPGDGSRGPSACCARRI